MAGSYFFKECFSRQASFNWLAIIIIGLMLRSDSLGLTSIIRDLNLSHRSYATMIHFFHASSWTLEVIAKKWCEIVKSSAPIYKEDGVTILVGDGVKASKEARKMPGEYSGHGRPRKKGDSIKLKNYFKEKRNLLKQQQLRFMARSKKLATTIV